MLKWASGLAIGAALGTVAFLAVFVWPGTTGSRSVDAIQPLAPDPLRTDDTGSRDAETDTPALSAGQHQASHFERTAALYNALLDADVATIETLLRDAERLTSRRESRAAKSVIYARFAELDHDAALARIAARGIEEARFLGTVFAAWARRNFDAALSRAGDLDHADRRRAAIAILSVAEGLPVARQREIAIEFGVEHVLQRALDVDDAESQPSRAWHDALAMPAGMERTQVAWRALQSWINADPIQALQALQEFPEPRVRDHWRQGLVALWAKTDVSAALEWATPIYSMHPMP